MAAERARHSMGMGPPPQLDPVSDVVAAARSWRFLRSRSVSRARYDASTQATSQSILAVISGNLLGG